MLWKILGLNLVNMEVGGFGVLMQVLGVRRFWCCTGDWFLGFWMLYCRYQWRLGLLGVVGSVNYEDRCFVAGVRIFEFVCVGDIFGCNGYIWGFVFILLQVLGVYENDGEDGCNWLSDGVYL